MWLAAGRGKSLKRSRKAAQCGQRWKSTQVQERDPNVIRVMECFVSQAAILKGSD
jgi:hypothetical protein